MQNKDKLNYLYREVRSWIKKKEKQVLINRRRAYALRLTTAILGAMVTISLGLRITDYDELLKNLALVFGSLIAVVNAFEILSRDRTLWIGRQIRLLKLYDLKERIEFLEAGSDEGEDISEKSVNKLFKDYRAIWASASIEWQRLQQEDAHVGIKVK